MGVGLTLGPLMSSGIYNFLGYSNTFYFFSAFITVFGFGCVCFMPARIDKVQAGEAEEKGGGVPGRSGSVNSFHAVSAKVRSGSKTSGRGMSMDMSPDEVRSRLSSMR